MQCDHHINRLTDRSCIRQSNKCWLNMSRILHDTIMMTEDSNPTTDEVSIKTMLQCDRGDRGIRVFAGIYNAEFEFFAVFSAFFSNGRCCRI